LGSVNVSFIGRGLSYPPEAYFFPDTFTIKSVTSSIPVMITRGRPSRCWVGRKWMTGSKQLTKKGDSGTWFWKYSPLTRFEAYSWKLWQKKVY
jgi:hypothetical protein